MFDLVAATGPTLVVEFSAASVEVFQTGRLVGGQDTGAGGASGRLRDPMLSILGGFTFGRATTTTVVVGPGYVDAMPTQAQRPSFVRFASSMVLVTPDVEESPRPASGGLLAS